MAVLSNGSGLKSVSARWIIPQSISMNEPLRPENIVVWPYRSLYFGGKVKDAGLCGIL